MLGSQRHNVSCQDAYKGVNRKFASRGRAQSAACANLASSSKLQPDQSMQNVKLVIPTEHSMGKLAHLFVAQKMSRGDCICLFGDVGAGKSVFSRAFIRAAANNDKLQVPSPTYLLQNMYDPADMSAPPIHHFDLYRLSGRDLMRLSLAESFADATCLIEWSERLAAAGALPPQHLAIHISIADEASLRLPRQPSAAATRQPPAAATDRLSPAAARVLEATHEDRSAYNDVRGSGASPGPHVQQGRATASTAAHAPVRQSTDEGGLSSSSRKDEVEENGEGEDDEDGEEYDEYTDRRVRHVVLQPVGDRWVQRVTDLRTRLQGEQHDGMYLVR